MCHPRKLKLPTQVPNNVTGYVPPFVDVILFNVQFDLTAFNVKILSMSVIF